MSPLGLVPVLPQFKDEKMVVDYNEKGRYGELVEKHLEKQKFQFN